MWKQWVNGILGLLVIVLALAQQGSQWLWVVIGLIIAVLAFWSAGEKKSM